MDDVKLMDSQNVKENPACSMKESSIDNVQNQIIIDSRNSFPVMDPYSRLDFIMNQRIVIRSLIYHLWFTLSLKPIVITWGIYTQ